jgi:exonuclease VII small subunit
MNYLERIKYLEEKVERLERGEICPEQAAELRMGA